MSRAAVVRLGLVVALAVVVAVVAVAAGVLGGGADDPGVTPDPDAGPEAAPSPDGASPRPSPAQPGRPVVELVVDGGAAGADDANPGTADAPLATIGEAAARADAANRDGDPVHVTVRPGTYRESVDLTPSSTATDAEVVIAGEGDVVLSGSQPYTDWAPVADGVWSHPWSRDWGEGAVPDAWLEGYGGRQLVEHPVTRRREMVFVDGQLLTPYTERARMRAEPGSFFVDEPGDLLLVNPPEGVDPREATVEVAERPTLLKIGGRSNVTVAGLTLQHAASPPQGKALVIVNADHVEVRDVVLQWNSWVGMAISQSTGVTVRNTLANHNGVGGMTGFEASDVLVEDSETSHNNWRGIRGAEDVEPGSPVDATFVDYAAGQKFLYMRRATFRRHTAVGNLSSGLWFDFDNRDVVVEDADVRDNLTWGLFFEASPGPLTVDGGRICGNEIGVLVANSADGTVTDALLVGNTLAQVHLAGRETRSVTDAVTGEGYEVRSQGWTLGGNTVSASGAGVALGSSAGGAAWDHFVDTLESDDNAFVGTAGALVDPGDTPTLSFEQWRRAGHDGASSLQDGPTSCDEKETDA